IIEKHFTLDKHMKGNDHACSLTPLELEALVKGIRDIEQSLGSPSKHMHKSEHACYEKLGKTIVAQRFLPQGTIIEEQHLAIKVAEPKGICGA
ncbi:sialic acid synthase, partial [Olea europaea subsp. europaea]